MAVLDAPNRRAVMAQIAAALDSDGPLTLTKDHLAAAVAGIDDYIEANAAAMNAAIPQPARGALSADQKAVLFAYTALRRNPKRDRAAAALAQGGR
jgi:hypothetical protein